MPNFCYQENIVRWVAGKSWKIEKGHNTTQYVFKLSRWRNKHYPPISLRNHTPKVEEEKKHRSVVQLQLKRAKCPLGWTGSNHRPVCNGQASRVFHIQCAILFRKLYTCLARNMLPFALETPSMGKRGKTRLLSKMSNHIKRVTQAIVKFKEIITAKIQINIWNKQY